MKKIYLDNSATTPVCKEVFEEMREYFEETFGNPSSLHHFGQKAKFGLDTARERVAKVINASTNEIYFTSGGTEADNWAIRGVLNANYKRIANGEKIHIITTAYEHPAILTTCKIIATKYYHLKGLVEFSFIKPDEKGYIHQEDIVKEVKPETVLVSVMHVNNEIGTINNIAEISKFCRDKKILFHTDAVQSFGKCPIDVQKMNIDLLSASAHKIHGPKGVGLLYVRKGVNLAPILYGGHQENQMRMGTENIAGIIGFGKAADMCLDTYLKDEHKRIKELKMLLYKLVSENLDEVVVNGDLENGYGGVLNLSFKGLEAESLFLNLDMEGIAVSTGSACSSSDPSPSKVLTAIGLSPEMAQSSLRISIGRYNTEEEIRYAADKIVGICKKLKSMGF